MKFWDMNEMPSCHFSFQFGQKRIVHSFRMKYIPFSQSHPHLCLCHSRISWVAFCFLTDKRIMKVQGKTHSSQTERAEGLRERHAFRILLELHGVRIHNPLNRGSGCKRTHNVTHLPLKGAAVTVSGKESDGCIIWETALFWAWGNMVNAMHEVHQKVKVFLVGGGSRHFHLVLCSVVAGRHYSFPIIYIYIYFSGRKG